VLLITLTSTRAITTAILLGVIITGIHLEATTIGVFMIGPLILTGRFTGSYYHLDCLWKGLVLTASIPCGIITGECISTNQETSNSLNNVESVCFVVERQLCVTWKMPASFWRTLAIQILCCFTEWKISIINWNR
jgi:hypothetical protein